MNEYFVNFTGDDLDSLPARWKMEKIELAYTKVIDEVREHGRGSDRFVMESDLVSAMILIGKIELCFLDILLFKLPDGSKKPIRVDYQS